MLKFLLKASPPIVDERIQLSTAIFVLASICLVILAILYIVFKTNLFRWQEGRQKETTYCKMLLLRFKIFRFGMDMYLLKYGPYIHLKKHIDELPQGKHYRLNWEIWGHGAFYVDKVIFRIKSKLVFFRPDLWLHSMVNGNKKRIVLSVGFGIFNKRKKF